MSEKCFIFCKIVVKNCSIVLYIYFIVNIDLQYILYSADSFEHVPFVVE